MSKTKFLERFADHGLDIPSHQWENIIDTDMRDKDHNIQYHALKNRNATATNLSNAFLYSGNYLMRRIAAGHKNATKEHLDMALDDYFVDVKEAAASNVNATKEHLDKALNDYGHDGYRIRAAAALNPNATKEHLDKALKDTNSLVRRWATENPNYKKFFPNGH